MLDRNRQHQLAIAGGSASVPDFYRDGAGYAGYERENFEEERGFDPL
jgi:hypothetical protein